MIENITQVGSPHPKPRLFSSFQLFISFFLILPLAFPSLARSQSLEAFEKRVTEHTLVNGWKFILVERPVAPVFAFMTRVNVGSAQEGAGVTGLAHMFEHMAFKGTPRLGTKDYQKEKPALKALEQAYLAYQEARFNPKIDTQEVDNLLKLF